MAVLFFLHLAGSLLFGEQVQIGDSEIGLLLRNGAYLTSLTPGTHAIDPATDEVYVVDLTAQRQVIFSCSAGESSTNCISVVTGDSAWLKVGVVVTYGIKDDEVTPYDLYLKELQYRENRSPEQNDAIQRWEWAQERGNAYLSAFAFTEPESAVRILSRSAVSNVLGSTEFLRVFWNDAREMEEEIRNLLQWKCDVLSSGLFVTDVAIQAILLPDEIRESFSGRIKSFQAVSDRASIDERHTDGGFISRREGNPPSERGRASTGSEVLMLPANLQIVSRGVDRYLTREKVFTALRTALIWKILDPELFHVSFPDVAAASDYLEDSLRGSTRSHIAVSAWPFERHTVDTDVRDAPALSAVEIGVLRDLRAKYPADELGLELLDVSLDPDIDPNATDSVLARMEAQLERALKYRLAVADSLKRELVGLIDETTKRVFYALESEHMDVGEAVHLMDYYFEDTYEEIVFFLEEVEKRCLDILHERLAAEILLGFQEAVSPVIDRFASEFRMRIDEILEERQANLNRIFTQ